MNNVEVVRVERIEKEFYLALLKLDNNYVARAYADEDCMFGYLTTLHLDHDKPGIKEIMRRYREIRDKARTKKVKN